MINSDGMVNTMYNLFAMHGWKPSEYYEMGYGERLIVRAFLSQEIKDRTKKQ